MRYAIQRALLPHPSGGTVEGDICRVSCTEPKYVNLGSMRDKHFGYHTHYCGQSEDLFSLDIRSVFGILVENRSHEE